ncbi:uncharacterized protein LOC129601883 [Paramacrobiotus metropolitanus]|uniref:uncharacterized protein LOC129601883 n=1 Tax=Paramacrobiotus metropolitanus TaxID=2943436 RepID=UPI00244575A4|nr:uncharacterized protein LOC129601883 [Paramacrobiotus metropolitanus]
MPLYVGHVNGTFKYREVNEKNSKEILHCPYNFRHQVPFEVFQKHLRACPDAAAKKELVDSCEFNPVHFYPALDVEREIHLQICPNRRQAPVRERPEKKGHLVTLPLCPLTRKEAGLKTRESQKPMPSVEDILGPEVRFVELEKNAAERMNRARKSTPFEEAIEDVMKNGPENMAIIASILPGCPEWKRSGLRCIWILKGNKQNAMHITQLWFNADMKICEIC